MSYPKSLFIAIPVVAFNLLFASCLQVETKNSPKPKAGLYPSYNTKPQPPDKTGMETEARTIAKKMGVGWNLGNSLEAIGGEAAWGNPKVDRELIRLVKKSGFRSIRLPTSWHQHMSDPTAAEIRQSWLKRVREVVQSCVDEGLYVLVNIHWDGGWLEENCTPDKQKKNNAMLKAFWEQIATELRDFDERVLFAGTNEPNVDNAMQMEVLASYLQNFVKTVRATGGRNYYRTLVVQAPRTDIEKAHKMMKALPRDVVKGRLMAEVHYYTPWNFCGLEKDESWGKMFYYWGKGNHNPADQERNPTWGEEGTLKKLFGLVKTKFTQKGIPVILGEYSSMRRSGLRGKDLELHLASRVAWTEMVTREALASGMVPMYWDNGHPSGGKLFDRSSHKVYDQAVLSAILKAAGDVHP